MIKENRELLLKDLCARLPYGVKIALKNSEAYHHDNVAKKGDVTIDRLKGFNGSYFSIYHDDPLDWDWCVSDINIKDIKPYLFPLSSMTEEQKIKCFEGTDIELDENSEIWSKISSDTYTVITNMDNWLKVIDWLLKNHFDIYGLIPKGLAIDCTNLNIY